MAKMSLFMIRNCELAKNGLPRFLHAALAALVSLALTGSALAQTTTPPTATPQKSIPTPTGNSPGFPYDISGAGDMLGVDVLFGASSTDVKVRLTGSTSPFLLPTEDQKLVIDATYVGSILGAATVNGTSLSGLVSNNGFEVVKNNQVWINLAPSEEVSYLVIGGVSQFGEATENKVYFTGGTVGAISGGSSSGNYADGLVSENVVIMTGGTVDTIYGGNVNAPACASFPSAVCGGSADANEIWISGGTVTGNIRGGSTNLGGASSNKIYINGGTFTDLTFKASVQGGHVVGNYQLSGINVNENTVEISGVTIGSVKGGQVEAANGANISDNTVTIIGSDIELAYGGQLFQSKLLTPNSADIDNNTVFIYNSTVSKGVAGAIINGIDSVDPYNGSNGTMNNNKVTIWNSNITEDVFGGYSESNGQGTDDISDNTVTIIGNSKARAIVAGMKKWTVYGDFGLSGTINNNEVILQGVATAVEVYGGHGGASQ
jgi:hypothetical protein